MTGRLLSLNIGASEPNAAKKVGVTGIGKKPVDSATLRAPGPKHGGLGSGVVGDFIADVAHHGGDQQAVYAFAREELDAWEERLGRELVDGAFGENLTTTGLDVDGALLGERWAVGDDVVLEVCGPRVPCETFQARMGERGWVKRFTRVGRTGAYLSIVTGGEIRPGDAIEVLSRPDHGVDVVMSFRAYSGDLELARRVLDSGALVGPDADELRERIERRTR